MQINLQTYLPLMAVNAESKRKNRARKRIVFLIHSAELFSAIEGVVNKFTADKERFECIFIAIPRDYSTQEKNYTGEKEVFKFLEEKGLDPLVMNGKSHADLFYLMNIAPDYIFRQSPWDHHLPECFRIPNLSFSKLCYVPYGMMLSGTENSQYNQPFHNFCDFIFSETDYHHQEFTSRRQLGGLGVHLVGSPRMESFQQYVEQNSAGAWPVDVPAGVPKVMWAPHHCFNPKWIGASTFFENKDVFLAYAQRKDISLLFRPHPAMKEKVVASGKMSEREYDRWLSDFESGPYSCVDRQSEYIDHMQGSDYMITDGISFFVEYMVTGKPLIRTCATQMKQMNNFGEWMAEKFRNLKDTPSLKLVLDQIVRGQYVDDEFEQRQEMKEFFKSINENASSKIHAVIANDAQLDTQHLKSIS